MIDDCWEWRGAKTAFGHGQKRFNGKTQYTHRIAYEWAFGPIPGGKCVLHKCDNPACCNPNHLFLGSRKDNAKDRDRKGRTAAGREHYLYKLTSEDIRNIRSDRRTYKAIAKDYGVHPVYIGQIKRKERRINE